MSKRISDNQAGGEHILEQLSAYIDNALDAGERERVRAHIETCEACRTEHRELQATKQMLFNLPVARPPRAFTLTQEMVGSKPSIWQRLRAPRWYPRLATGSVVAFGLLVMLLLGNLANNQYAPAAIMAGPSEEYAGLIAGTPDAIRMLAGASATPEAFTQAADAAEPTAMAVAGGVDAEVQLTPLAKAAVEVPATGGPAAANPAQAPASTASAPELNMSTVAGTPQAGYTEARRGLEEGQSRPPAAEQPLPYPLAPSNNVSWAFILQVSLVVLGVALGVGAIIARIRGV
ncbi:MAG TPA: zf-HC2 domain-containing protein [Chloroflexia bacterium]|jgi:anti-sigma factor RsiW